MANVTTRRKNASVTGNYGVTAKTHSTLSTKQVADSDAVSAAGTKHRCHSHNKRKKQDSTMSTNCAGKQKVKSERTIFGMFLFTHRDVIYCI